MSDQEKNIVIGDLLVKVGLIASADLSEAMQVSRRLGMPMGRVLTMSGSISPEIFQLALEAQSIIRDGVVPPDVGVEALLFAIREKVPMKDAIARIDRHPQFSGTTNRLGELLLDAQIVNEEQLEQALSASMESGLPLGGTLVTQGIIHASLLPTVLRAQEQIRDGIVTRDAAIAELRASMQLWARAEAAMKAAEFAHESHLNNKPSNVMSTLRDTLESTSGSQSGFPQPMPVNEHLHQHLQQNQQQQSLQHQLQAMQPVQANSQQFQNPPMQQAVPQQQYQPVGQQGHTQQPAQTNQYPQPQFQPQGYTQSQPLNLQQQLQQQHPQPQYQQLQQQQPQQAPTQQQQQQQQPTQQFAQPSVAPPGPPQAPPPPAPYTPPPVPPQRVQAAQPEQVAPPDVPAAPIYGYNTPYGHAPYGGPAPEDPWGSWHGQVPRAPGLGMPIPAFQPGIAQPPAVPPEGYTPPPGFGPGQDSAAPQARAGEQVPVSENWNAHQPQPEVPADKAKPKITWAAPQGTKSSPVQQPVAKLPEKDEQVSPPTVKPQEHKESMGDQVKSAAAQLASRLGWSKASEPTVSQDADLPAPKKLSWTAAQKDKVEEKDAEPINAQSFEEQKASLQEAASLNFDDDEPGEEDLKEETAQTDADVVSAFDALEAAEVETAEAKPSEEVIEAHPDADPIIAAVIDESVVVQEALADVPAVEEVTLTPPETAVEEAVVEVKEDSQINVATADSAGEVKRKGIAGFEKGTKIHLKTDYSPNETGRLFSISHDEALLIRAEDNTSPLTDKKPEKGKKGKGKGKQNAASQSQNKLAQQPAKGKKGKEAARKSQVGLPPVTREAESVPPWSPLKSQAHPATQFGKRGGVANIPDFLEDLLPAAETPPPIVNSPNASQTKISAVSQRATSLSVSNLLPVPLDTLEAQAELALYMQSHGAPLPMPQLPFYTPAIYPETPATIVELLTMGGFFTRKDIATALDKALEDASLAPELLMALGLVAEETLDIVLRCQTMTRNRELTSEQAMYVLGAVRSGRLSFDDALAEIGKSK